MGYQTDQSSVWRLAAEQHGVVSRAQLLDRGVHSQGIKHRVAVGRLHPIRRGVYAVGRRQITRHGEWLAAVLACGPEALLSHDSAAALWRIRPDRAGAIHISIPLPLTRSHPGLVVHRRSSLTGADLARYQAIPVTSPVRTLIDLATSLMPRELEAAVNEADKLDLVDPEMLRAALDERRGQPGVGPLRRLLDRDVFTLSDSELERLFLPIARRAGLPSPLTQVRVNGFRVDFYWPDLGLVVETDGLRYHRTPAAQARDRLRDQAHLAAGLTPLRFTHAQIKWERDYVERTLASVAARLPSAPH